MYLFTPCMWFGEDACIKRDSIDPKHACHQNSPYSLATFSLRIIIFSLVESSVLVLKLPNVNLDEVTNDDAD